MPKLGAIATVTACPFSSKVGLACIVNIEYFVHVHSEIVVQRVNKVNICIATRRSFYVGMGVYRH